MADIREVFPILEDGSNVGQVPRAKAEGDAPSTHLGLLGFSFKDAAGNVVLPQLDSQGRLPVSEDGAGTCITGRGIATPAGSGPGNAEDLVTLTLTASKLYKDIEWVVSCFRDAVYQIIHLDDVTETIKAEVIVGAGDYTDSGILKCLEFTAGASGTQSLILRAYNLNAVSDVRGTLSVLELA